MSIDPTSLRAPVPSRPRPARRGRWERVPYTVRVAIPVLVLVVLGYYGLRAFESSRARIRLVDAAGEPLALDVPLELFAYDARPHAPSPSPSIGTVTLDEDGGVTVDREQIGAAALVRVDAPDCGIGYGFVRPGETCDLRLGAPVEVHGVVVRDETETEADGATPIGGARVLVFGGGPRGVLLAETASAPDGSFTVGGISSTVRDWTFRVFADGYAVGELQWLSAPDETVRLPLRVTLPARGRLVALTDGDSVGPELGDLEVRVYQLPGVTTRTAADGSFEIPWLPPSPARVAIVVPELPEGWTYRRVGAVAGETTEVRVVPARTIRGRVISGHDALGVAGVVVHHDHGPLGIESATCDSSGRFELHRVPLGPVEIFAHVMVDRDLLPAGLAKDKQQIRNVGRLLVQGTANLLVVPDQEPGEVEITIR